MPLSSLILLTSGMGLQNVCGFIQNSIIQLTMDHYSTRRMIRRRGRWRARQITRKRRQETRKGRKKANEGRRRPRRRRRKPRLQLKETHYLESSPPKVFVLIRCIPPTCARLQVMASDIFANTLNHINIIKPSGLGTKRKYCLNIMYEINKYRMNKLIP